MHIFAKTGYCVLAVLYAVHVIGSSEVEQMPYADEGAYCSSFRPCPFSCPVHEGWHFEDCWRM